MEQKTSNTSATAATASGVQFLTFRVGAADYGLDILSVQEIRGHAPITPVPNAAPHVKGVMNLRGAIIPVLDLGLRLGTGPVEAGPLAVTIVVRKGATVAGLVVDAVSDVMTAGESDLQPAPDVTGGVSATLIKAVVRKEAGLHLVLDVERILAEEQLPAGVAA